MYKDIVDRLISLPLRSQIKVDFDFKKKVFRLSIPIFSSRKGLPKSIQEYIEAREKRIFKPHVTYYEMENGNRALLVQEVPFEWGFQPTLRTQIDDFFKMGRHCNRMLSEIAVEEQLKFS